MHPIFAAQTADGTLYGLKVGGACDVSLNIKGTWDGAIVTVQESSDAGANYHDWKPDGSALTFTADKQVTFSAGPGQRFRFVITNVGTTSLNAFGGGDFVTKISTARE